MKDTFNIILLQEQIMNALIKINTIESMLIDKKIIDKDEYSKKLTETANMVFDKLKPALDSLKQIKSQE